jgi:parallel beta-helix repeat protein
MPAGRGSDESVVNGAPGAGHVIRTDNTGITIDGFTLNSNPASPGQNGASISARSPETTVANNIINGLALVPTNIASGILTATFSNQTLLHNNAQGFRFGVQPDGGPADALSAIDGNYLSNNTTMGIQIQSSVSGGHSILNNLIELNGFDGIFVTRGEIVSGNTIRDNGRAGILLFSLGNGTLTGVMITDNEIRNNAQWGIRLSGNDAGDLSNNLANRNNIVGNTAGVVSTLASTVFDAECNWWGSATGPRDPAGNPFGTGDSSTGNVDYEPWLIAPAPGGACIGEPLPEAGKVTGGGQIDVANGRGSFGFNAKLDEGETTGHLNYRNHATGAHLNCTVTEFLVLTPTTATFSGTCNPQSSADEFTAHVEDNGQPGKNNDEFTIEYNGITEGGTLRSGNIQIHQ